MTLGIGSFWFHCSQSGGHFNGDTINERAKNNPASKAIIMKWSPALNNIITTADAINAVNNAVYSIILLAQIRHCCADYSDSQW